jgi:primosomal protein N' (replication factor Y)
VPEIALTPQMVRWFHARFGADAAVLHSGLSKGERFDEWRRIRSGEARVVIGARSAIFAPAHDIGLIVVDEEHEHTYQSDKRPRYDAREVAAERARASGAVLILGSATPSVSTYMRALPGVKPENRLTLIELTARVMDRPLPEVEIVDMRNELEKGNHAIFSGPLQAALRKCLDEGRQAMLFINRRGYSTFVSCRACGKAVKCPNCDVTMTYHQTEDLLKCHYCGEVMRPPRACPSCSSKYIKYFGSGTQKVEEAVRTLFPDARIGRLDLDTTARKDSHESILEAFRGGETNVLVGTQMITKGLDFPNVTLVGVVAADMSLNLPDYRSTERTFQLITQVAGRAGRSDAPGRVIVQTYDPDHYAIRLAAKQDYRAFYNRESKYRRMGLYPPFTVIARIVFTAKALKDAVRAAEEAESALNRFIDEIGERKNVVQMRAVESPIALLRGEARHQVFLKMYFKGGVRRVTEKMRDLAEVPRAGVRAELEVNPVNMI